jgi:TonB-dependent receptor-like protein
MNFDVFNCSRGCNGVYEFRDMANFLRGTPRRFEGLLPGGDITNRELTQSSLGAYVQDNWRVKRSLTLNLGLRYEYATRIEEVNGFTSQLINITDPAPTVGPLYAGPPTNLAFSPRVGFAWTPNQGKSSLRGGFGIFYEHPNLFLIRTALAELPPFTLVGRIENAPGGVAFPNAFATQLGLARQRPNARAFDYDFDQTYSLRWNLTYQRQFGKSVVGSVEYTSSRGHNLWHQNLANLCRWEGYPDQPSGPKFFPAPCQLINPNLGEIRYQQANARSWYNGLSLGLQRSARDGVRFGGAFTWSKSVDQGSGVTSGGEELPQSQRGIYGYDLNLKQGLSSHDRRFVLSSYVGYEAPWARDAKGLGGLLAKGWKFNAIFSFLSGYPLSVLELSDAQIARLGDDEDLRPNLVPGGDNNPVTGDPDRWFDVSQFTPSKPGFFGDLGRNTITAPNQMTLDLSVLKDVHVGLGYMQLRAEVFNVLNRTNYGEPDMEVFINGQVSPTAARITSTNTPARRMQLGLRWVF